MSLAIQQTGMWRSPGHSIDTLTPGSTNSLSTTLPTTSSAYPSASMAIYVPLRVKARRVVKKLSVANGGTVSGNVDMAVYNSAGTRLVTVGGVAQSGTSQDQTFDVTDTTIGPGLFYLAVVLDNTTGTIGRDNDAAPLCAAQGLLTEASAYPLPATATWSVDQTLAFYPAIAMLLTTVVT